MPASGLQPTTRLTGLLAAYGCHHPGALARGRGPSRARSSSAAMSASAWSAWRSSPRRSADCS